jgi:hypothetical protein
MAIDQLIANGSFGPDEIGVMKAAYVAALIDVGVTDRDDPITELIAKSIVNVTATGERNPKEVMERALNEAFVALRSAIPGPRRVSGHKPLARRRTYALARQSIRGKRPRC